MRNIGTSNKKDVIEIAAGTGGIILPRPASKISLLDIYRASEAVKEGQFFKIHEDTQPSGVRLAEISKSFYSY